jgi:hypothetical protein
LEAAFRRARNMAAASLEPTRVIVDCSRRFSDGCATTIQTPVLDGLKVLGWRSHSGPRMRLNVRDQVVKAKEGIGHDGLLTRPDVCWVVFTPDGRILSDPKPFVIVVKDLEPVAASAKPWRIAISEANGAITVERDPW